MKLYIEKDGRSFKVMVENADGEHFCMTRTTDESWANTYLCYVEYFFKVRRVD